MSELELRWLRSANEAHRARPVAALAGCATSNPPAAAPSVAPSQSTFQMLGSVSLGAGDFTWDDDLACSGRGGYDDLRAGTQVVVTDQAGTTIAIGTVDKTGAILDPDLQPASCNLYFSVPDVPAGKSFYGVEISHRGRVQYTEEQARGHLDMTLG